MLSLESPSYFEYQPRAELRRLVAVHLVGGPVSPQAEPVLPDGCMDLVWDGARLFVAGPDTGPKPDVHSGPLVVGLRLRPGAGSVILGVPAVELRDERADLRCLWKEA